MRIRRWMLFYCGPCKETVGHRWNTERGAYQCTRCGLVKTEHKEPTPMKRTSVQLCGLVILLAAVSAVLDVKWPAFATGTSYSLVGAGNAAQTGTVTTSAVTTLTVTADDLTIAHLGLQDDGSSASSATDTIVVMNSYDSAGNAISMSADYSAGAKYVIVSGSAWVINGADVPKDANGVRKIQIKATGHGATFTAKREK